MALWLQCHLRNVIVRDVKPDNFLYLHPSPDAPLKGVDFGMAEYCQPGQMLSDRAGGCCMHSLTCDVGKTLAQAAYCQYVLLSKL